MFKRLLTNFKQNRIIKKKTKECETLDDLHNLYEYVELFGFENVYITNISRIMKKYKTLLDRR